MNEDKPKRLVFDAEIDGNRKSNAIQCPMGNNSPTTFDVLVNDEFLWLVYPICFDIKIVIDDITSRGDHYRGKYEKKEVNRMGIDHFIIIDSNQKGMHSVHRQNDDEKINKAN